MDLLEQYKLQNPEAFRPKEREPELGQGEYGFIIRFVIHLPGGFIRNAKQASYALLGAAGMIVLISLIILFWPEKGNLRTPQNEIIFPQNEPPRLKSAITP